MLYVYIYIMSINTYVCIVCIENGFIADIWAMCVYNIGEAQRLQTGRWVQVFLYSIICVYEGETFNAGPN